jgi:hypothetical protein
MADTDVAQFRCKCENHIAIVNAKFRAFSGCGTNAQKGKEIDQITMTSGNLALFQQSNNMVKIEFWDAGTWNYVGCFSVNAGDTVIVEGVTQNFAVYINGKVAQPCLSEQDCLSV